MAAATFVRGRGRVSPVTLGLALTVLLVALSMVLPWLLDVRVWARYFPPLHARWDPHTGPGTLPALALAVLASLTAVDGARRLPWGWLLVAVLMAGLAWLLALAYVDGVDGLGSVLAERQEYLYTARRVDDVHAVLRSFVSRIPFGAHRAWPVHVAGHPPGALLFFVVLVRLGLDTGLLAGLVVVALAATTPVAVLVTVRTLGAPDLARRAAPFLTFGPAAVWSAVSADAVFAAVSAWGIAALALAATRRSPAWSVVAGLLLGAAVLMSYGLPLLGLLALAVLVAARSWFPLPIAIAAALAPVVTLAVFGFSYVDALPVLRERYFAGIAKNRPPEYWLWGDLAALAISAGPLLGAGLAHLAAQARRRWTEPSWRVAGLLAGAAVAMVLVADTSQMSRAEVERIWLPFGPWLLLSCALLPLRWRRAGLVLQVLAALVVQHLLATVW